MSEEMKPLLACPFCGGAAWIVNGGRVYCSSVNCLACGPDPERGKTGAEKWNTRATPAHEPVKVKLPQVNWCYDSSDQRFEYYDPEEVIAALKAAGISVMP